MKSKGLHFRYLLIVLVIAVICLAILFKMSRTIFVEREKWQAKAEKPLYDTVPVLAARGNILAQTIVCWRRRCPDIPCIWILRPMVSIGIHSTVTSTRFAGLWHRCPEIVRPKDIKLICGRVWLINTVGIIDFLMLVFLTCRWKRYWNILSSIRKIPIKAVSFLKSYWAGNDRSDCWLPVR